ncbi:hypothetical protein MANI_009212 [Metarhizium anisopliae]|nr:hypothetical protein MANI_009212 [Metarhizium anisopliae]
MSLRVFLVESLGFPRSHHAIFVETSRGGGGYIFHVTGNIQQGMRYEMKATDAAPDTDPSYHGQTRLGWSSANDMARIDAICKSNPAPEKQFALNLALRTLLMFTYESFVSLSSASYSSSSIFLSG